MSVILISMKLIKKKKEILCNHIKTKSVVIGLGVCFFFFVI